MALDDKAKQDMESGLEHAVRVVQTRFTQLEQNVFIPSMESSRRFSNKHPILAMFISIFSILSLFPIISFLVFVLVVSVTFASTAFAVALFFSTVLIIAAGGALAVTLCLLFAASIFLTITVVSLFLTARLGQYLRSEANIRQGIAGWAQETRERLTWRGAKPHIGTDSEVKDGSASASRVSDEWQPVNGQS